jgi:AcrR family transcriptional regulator
MARRSKFSEAQILDAATTLVAEGGTGAATIGAIGALLDAPSGSIYHRFPSRDVLLGRLWLSKAALFQNNFVAALANEDPVVAAVEGALSLPRTTRADFAGARIMLLHRREDFLGDGWPAEMQAEARRLRRQVHDALERITRRLFGRVSAVTLRTATFAVLDIPFGVVRRHVAANEPPPPAVDRLIETASLAIIRAERGGLLKAKGEVP